MRKKILVILLSIISVICVAFGAVACDSSESGSSAGGGQGTESTESGSTDGTATTKQVPVYQGMVISSAESSASSASAKVASAALADQHLADGDQNGYYDDYGNYYDGNGGYYDVNGSYHDGYYDYYYDHYHYRGDYEGKDEDIDYDQPYDEEAPTIEQEIETTLKVTGTGQDIYYADKGEDIYITVVFSNPDSYEILSFVINGTKYTSYIFQNGSDLENIIVKLNVGTVGGINEYTIDEIKYVDGTEIKDVLLNGDTVVKCGVRADDQTYATVSNETHDLNSISFTAKIVDLYSLIEYSDGYVMAVLYDGESLVQTVDLTVGTNTVQFTNLTPNTLYQYAIVALYDDLSGTGTALNYLYKNAVYTDTIVLFDNITVGQESITFGYSWYDGYSAATITQLTLTSGGKTQTLENSSATSVTGLLTNTEYVLTAYYVNLDGATESISLTFTTLEKATPVVEITGLTSTQTAIDYALTVTDTDAVGSITSVTLSLNGKTVDTLTSATGNFSGLLSNNTYTVTVVYTYNLNDGTGSHELEVTDTITTQAKATPVVEITGLTSTQTTVDYTLDITDTDSVGAITSVTLTLGEKEIGTLDKATGNFSGLLSNNTYTVTVIYTYDLNDGKGEQKTTVTKDIATEAKATPVVEITGLTSTQTTVDYALDITDTDSVGSITSVTLTLGEKEIGTLDKATGTFSGLLSNNTYTVTVVYTYDLNDGTGSHELEVTDTITTQAKATPVVVIDTLTSTQTTVDYELAITDTDSVGSITSVTLTLGEKEIATGTDDTDTFSGLLSNNTYTVTVVYTYDLNDGKGEQKVTVTKDIATEAKATPVVVISDLTSTQTTVDYELDITDTDTVGSITSVTLSLNGKTVDTLYTATGTFSGLLSNNTYTVTVIYTYNLNDGTGSHELEVTDTITTQAKATPVVEITSLTSTQTAIDYELAITDTDSVGSITSVTLTLGEKEIGTLDTATGNFSGLLSNNTYTVTVIYTYNLNDGTGSHELEVTDTITTQAKATPVVVIDTLTSTQTAIDYALTVTDTDAVGSITSVTLSLNGKTVETLDKATGKFETLLSNNTYTVTVIYTYDLNDGKGEQKVTVTKDITTQAKATPTVEISTLTSEQESISYVLTITDTDNVGLATSVTLMLGETEIKTLTTTAGIFENLLSNNTYTITAIHTYNLNDGKGDQTAMVTDTITTLAKATPTVEITMPDSSDTSVTFTINYTDTDNIGDITAINLYCGDNLVDSATDTNATSVTFTGLSADTQYILIVNYQYNLNDGNGTISKYEQVYLYTEFAIGYNSFKVLNTSAVSEGETIIVQAELYNPNNVTFTKVVINGATYSVSALSTSTKIRVEILNDGQFDGGDTELTLSAVYCTYGGNAYKVDLSGNITASVFINGELTVDDITVVHLVDGQYEETYYGFYSEQLYYQITLNNATCYEVYSVTIGTTTYDSDDITMSDDYQIAYVAIGSESSGWKDYTFSSISYSNSTIDKTKTADLVAHYMRLSSDKIVEITTAEQLLDVDDYKYYKLINDIDLSGYEWANMGNNMYGVFDGNNYTISNMSAMTSYSDTDLYLGLFCELSGIVINLNITDALYMVTINNETGNRYDVYAGGIACYSYNQDNTILDNCDVEISVQITNNNTIGKTYVGGAIGQIVSATYVKLSSIKIDAVFSITATDISLGGIGGYISTNSVCLSEFYVNLTASVSSVGSYGTYFGEHYNSCYLLSIGNATASSTITVKSNGAIYYGVDDFLFIYENGEYLLMGYSGTDTDIILPDYILGNTYSIRSGAFYNYTTLTSVTIPDTVTSIGKAAFDECGSLVKVVIGNGVTTIEDSAFWSCSSLTSITIGNSVSSIGNETFCHCTSLESIIIPDSVTSIGSSAFYNCSSLTSVYYDGTASEWTSISIDGKNDCLTSATIYYYSETEPTESGNYWHYNANNEIEIWS